MWIICASDSDRQETNLVVLWCVTIYSGGYIRWNAYTWCCSWPQLVREVWMSIQHSSHWEESIHYAPRHGRMCTWSVGCTWRRFVIVLLSYELWVLRRSVVTWVNKEQFLFIVSQIEYILRWKQFGWSYGNLLHKIYRNAPF
jgi:hypothetical protein